MASVSKRGAGSAAVEAFVLGFAVVPVLFVFFGVILIPLLQLVVGDDSAAIAKTFWNNVGQFLETAFTLGLVLGVGAAGYVFAYNTWPQAFARVTQGPADRETRIDVALVLGLLIVFGFLSLVALISGGLGIALSGAFGAAIDGYVDMVRLAQSYLQVPLDAAADGINWLLKWNVRVQPLWLHVFLGVAGVLAQPLLFIELSSGQRELRRAPGWSLLFWAVALALFAAGISSPATLFIVVLSVTAARMFAYMRSAQSELMMEATIFILPFVAFVAVWLNQLR